MDQPPLASGNVEFPRQISCPKCNKPLMPAGVCLSCVNKRGLLLAVLLLFAAPVGTTFLAATTSFAFLVDSQVSPQQRADAFYWSMAAPSVVALVGLAVCAAYAGYWFTKTQAAVRRYVQSEGANAALPTQCPLCGRKAKVAGSCRRCWVRQSFIGGLTCLLLAPYLSICLLLILALNKQANTAGAAFVGWVFFIFGLIMLSYSALQVRPAKKEEAEAVATGGQPTIER